MPRVVVYIWGGGGCQRERERESACAVMGNIWVLEILIPAVAGWNGRVEMVLCN